MSRDDLITANIDYPGKIINSRFRMGLPSTVDYDELLSVGRMGLVEAATKFDKADTTEFTSFAYTRIYGSIVDYLRKLDTAYNGISRRIEKPLTESRKEISVSDADTRPSIEEILLREDLIERLHDLVLDLPQRDYLMVTQYYFLEKQLKEVGELVGLTESGVSLNLKRIRAELQSKLS